MLKKTLGVNGWLRDEEFGVHKRLNNELQTLLQTFCISRTVLRSYTFQAFSRAQNTSRFNQRCWDLECFHCVKCPNVLQVSVVFPPWRNHCENCCFHPYFLLILMHEPGGKKAVVFNCRFGRYFFFFCVWKKSGMGPNE